MPIFGNQNTPQKFWLCEPPVPDLYWQEAIRKVIHLLDLTGNIEADELPALTLSEGRYGKDHWKLSWPKRLYYLFKPLLPRALGCMTIHRFLLLTIQKGVMDHEESYRPWRGLWRTGCC